MTEVKLTKNELRDQQKRLQQLRRYLPTLQLKKAMLQAEVQKTRAEIITLRDLLSDRRLIAEESCSLLSQDTLVKPEKLAVVTSVEKEYENLAGVEVPIFRRVSFQEVAYSLFATPPWVDVMVAALRGLAEARVKVSVAEEKKRALEAELREVSIRVNLFEKVLIPRAVRNIKRITVFLGDQELASVGRAKVAKKKIEERRMIARARHAV